MGLGTIVVLTGGVKGEYRGFTRKVGVESTKGVRKSIGGENESLDVVVIGDVDGESSSPNRFFGEKKSLSVSGKGRSRAVSNVLEVDPSGFFSIWESKFFQLFSLSFRCLFNSLIAALSSLALFSAAFLTDAEGDLWDLS